MGLGGIFGAKSYLDSPYALADRYVVEALR
jgi:hypothetical protein